MKSQAIYVGSRDYKREKKVDENGEVIFEAMTGRQYLFYCAEWDEDTGDIEGMGKTRFEQVEDKNVKEYEEKLPDIGGFCTVTVRESFGNQNNNLCKFHSAGF